MKFIKLLISLVIIIFRINCVFHICKGLYLNHTENTPLDDVKWYIYFIIVDFYILSVINNSLYFDIYVKKDNESDS